MAGIDKLWLSSYYDLSTLRSWALVYYPKLFIWLDITYTSDAFKRCKMVKAETFKRSMDAEWRRVSSDGTINAAIAHYINEGYSEEEAREEAENLHTVFLARPFTLQEDMKLPVMNTPIKIDKKLKWICPVPCVREYLKNQCGVKEHWYYKLFWRGKKYFEY